MGKYLSHFTNEAILDVFSCAGSLSCALHPDSSCSVHLEADLDRWVPQPLCHAASPQHPCAGCRRVAGRRERKAGTFISRIGPMRCVMLDQARTPADRPLH